MKLYELKNKIGSYWVIAEDPTKAENKLMEYLNDADYGVSSRRTVTEIHLISTSTKDKRFITGHHLII